MSAAVRTIARAVVRFAILWLVDAVSLFVTSLVVPGVSLQAVDDTPVWVVAVAAAFLLGLVNFLIRPLVLLLARPFGLIVLFIIGFVVNALALLVTAGLLPGFDISGLLAAIVAGIVFAAVNAVITGVLEVDEEGSYYQNRMERRARQSPFAGATEPGLGLVMIEIDGLSFHHLKQVLADGRMPYLSKLMAEEGYTFSRVDCGLPSQTSACQAGIMYGDNHDIPAFRWFDKDEQKLFVSSKDAAAINSRYAHGDGLMRGGTSIDNMMSGDAEKSLLTLAELRTTDDDLKKRRAEDLYLLMLNPYILMRTLALFFGSALREVWQGWRQKSRGDTPRLNRLHGFYPFVRAATCVFMRDIPINLTVLDIMRGSPSIYVCYVGYDEVAHHSGPWTGDAFGELARFDRSIARVHRVIKEKAPRPYELILLSDHGQSFGATFLQRYDMSLKEFIERQLPAGVSVAQSMGGDTGVTSLAAASAELENVQQQGVGSGVGRAIARQGSDALNTMSLGDQTAVAAPAQVTAYGSGNLAQVYFDLFPRRILLSELDEAYPGMVDALVAHEGIGFVCGYADDGSPVALGKGGMRNLHTDEVTGDDPLAPYANDGVDTVGAASIETRVWQVRRVMDFPHAGDLMVVSALFPDGTVAALEELIGSHGGLGGEQTDAFIFHPADMDVPPTRNSIDVFHILNGRRGQPVPEAAPAGRVSATPSRDAWSPGNLLGGLVRVDRWVPRALACLILDREAYEDVVADPSMTGPAMLIALLAALLTSIAQPGDWTWPLFVTTFVLWVVVALAVFAAGWLLSKRGDVTTTVRALGFAMITHIFELLMFISVIGNLGRILSVVVGFLAIWMGAATAHRMKGVRVLALPILAVVVLVGGAFALRLLIAGGQFTIDALLQEVGVRVAE